MGVLILYTRRSVSIHPHVPSWGKGHRVRRKYPTRGRVEVPHTELASPSITSLLIRVIVTFNMSRTGLSASTASCCFIIPPESARVPQVGNWLAWGSQTKRATLRLHNLFQCLYLVLTQIILAYSPEDTIACKHTDSQSTRAGLNRDKPGENHCRGHEHHIPGIIIAHNIY